MGTLTACLLAILVQGNGGIDAVLNRVASGEFPSPREQLVLKRSGRKGAERLEARYKKAPPNIRRRLLAAAGIVDAPGYKDVVRRALGDPDPDCERVAVMILHSTGLTAPVPQLMRMIKTHPLSELGDWCTSLLASHQMKGHLKETYHYHSSKDPGESWAALEVAVDYRDARAKAAVLAALKASPKNYPFRQGVEGLWPDILPKRKR